MITTVPHPKGKTKVLVNFIGTDSHALAITGLFCRKAKEQGFNKEWIDEVREEMLSADYTNVLATALKYSTTELEGVYPTEETPEEDKEYEPLFWGNKHPLSQERTRILETYMPEMGTCVDNETGEVNVFHEAYIRIGGFNYDIYNNGGGNDYSRQAQAYLDGMEEFKDFFQSEKEYHLIERMLEFYIEKKEWLEESEECGWCDGSGYEERYIGTDDEGEEEYETEDCSACGGNCYEEREFDFYKWIHEENRMKLLDEAIAAPVRYALSLEKEGKMVTSYGVTQRRIR